MNEQIQCTTISFNIPNNIVELLKNIVSKPFKCMHFRKCDNAVFLKFLLFSISFNKNRLKNYNTWRMLTYLVNRIKEEPRTLEILFN